MWYCKLENTHTTLERCAGASLEHREYNHLSLSIYYPWKSITIWHLHNAQIAVCTPPSIFLCLLPPTRMPNLIAQGWRREARQERVFMTIVRIFTAWSLSYSYLLWPLAAKPTSRSPTLTQPSFRTIDKVHRSCVWKRMHILTPKP